MNEQSRIIAITVSYNRAITLKRCIYALLSQTRQVDEIIIVDNNSCDEERAVIRDIASSDPRISVIWLSENLGGAGGFEAGMKAGCDSGKGYDFFWIMDDDAYPRPDCLEKLLDAYDGIEHQSGTKKTGFLAPLIYGIDLRDYQLYHHKCLRGLALQDKQVTDSVDKLSETVPVEANAFVGVLVSRLAIQTVGITDGGMFIYGDDTEYTYRVSRSMMGYLVRDAVIDHQDPPLTGNFLQPEAWWKEYYKHRNRFFIVREFRTGPGRIVAYFLLSLPLLAQIPSALLKPKYRGFHLFRVRMLIQAMLDGILNRRGKTIDPEQYIADIKKMRSGERHQK